MKEIGDRIVIRNTLVEIAILLLNVV